MDFSYVCLRSTLYTGHKKGYKNELWATNKGYVNRQSTDTDNDFFLNNSGPNFELEMRFISLASMSVKTSVSLILEISIHLDYDDTQL